MASVLFSTVGQAIGGPLGAGIGAAVGATVDASLFRRSRQGISDLYVQRSAYGTTIPRLFGTTRTAGQVIWALPMAAGRQPKGSGRRAVVTSFAIAVSSGPIADVRRMWADGREIRNAEGQFEIDIAMRVHSAGESAPDPWIVAAEGVGLAPGFAGLSYAVFENFDLGPFGNRIPNLSFEVVADEGSSAAWLAAIAEQAGATAEGSHLGGGATGYTAAAERLSDDLATLAAVTDATPTLVDGVLAFRVQPRTFEIAAEDLLAMEGPAGILPQQTVGERPRGIGIDYLDPSRDYQMGRQQLAHSRSGRELSVSWPICATAQTARSIAMRLLRAAEFGAENLVFGLPWRWLDLTVGDWFRIAGGPLWRVVRRDVRGLALYVEAERVPETFATQTPESDAGRSLPAPLSIATPTIAMPFEPPVPVQGSVPSLLVAMGGDTGWRGASVSLLASGEETVFGTALPGVALGRLVQPFQGGTETLWDEVATLLVEVEAGADFQSRSVADVLAGANLVLLGEELLQFRLAESVGPQMIRLKGLLRGRFGTAGRAVGAPAGTVVIAVAAGSLPALPLEPDQIGRDLVVLATGRGDPPGGTEIIHTVKGDGLAPLAPVHFRCLRAADGTIVSSWNARHRELWQWGAGSDPAAPPFIWRLDGDDGESRLLQVSGLAMTLSASEQLTKFGGLLPTGTAAVEAIGDGPVDLRRSSGVRV